jgi:hypothetical protein
MDDLRRFTRYGECKRGVNNKYYEVEAVEHEDGSATYTFRWARIGYECSKPTTERVFSFEEAKRRCLAQWEKKKAKYKEVNAMEALASAVQELDERETRGLSAVELEAPCFHAGKSEARCQQFAKKWLAKLNLVRKSKWDLGDRYNKQIETILKGYCAEWQRICKTKAHGHLRDNAAAHTAFRIFFSDLKDNAGTYVYGYFEGVGTS